MPTHRHPHRERNQLNQSWTCPQTVLTNRQPNTMKRQLQFETHCMHRIWENTLNKITCNAFHVLPAPPGTSYKRPWEVGGGAQRTPTTNKQRPIEAQTLCTNFCGLTPTNCKTPKCQTNILGHDRPNKQNHR